MHRLKHAVIVLGTLGAVVPFLVPLFAVRDAPVPPVAWAIVVLSTLANAVVLTYHWVAPAHPKFRMIRSRRLILGVHVVSGTVELAAALVALATGSTWAAIAAAAVALSLHVPSALAQTAIVFGSRAIMRPSYLACIAIHAFAACQLLRFPDSTFWLVSTFLVFNVYVWVRVYYFALDLTGMFGEAKYSVAVILAGMTTVPAIVGPATVLLIGAAVAVHYALYRALVLDGSREDAADFVRERARDVAIHEEVLSLWSAEDAEGDRSAAELYFESLDKDHDGAIGPADVERALMEWKIPRALVRALLAAHDLPERIDIEAFHQRVWSIGRVRERARRFAGTVAARSDQDRAAFVFRRIDLDGDGYIGRFELELLLMEWGLPAADVDRWLTVADADGDGRIGREEFFAELEPVWRFVYYVVVEARHTRHDDVSRKVFGAYADAWKTRAVRSAIGSDRLAHVELFAGASDAFLRDVTAALAMGEHPVGTVLFREGEVGRAFYVIDRGRISLSTHGVPLADIGPGTCLGEGALLSEGARAATATVTERAVLYSMTRDTFHYLLARHPGMKEHLERVDRERHSSESTRRLAANILARVPLFHGLGCVDELAAVAERRGAAARAVLFEEGSAGDEMLVLVEGCAQASSAGEIVAHLTPGACVGEGSVLTGDPRSATVRALTPCTVLALHRDVLLAHPPLVLRLEETRAERQRADVRRIVDRQRREAVSALSAIEDNGVDRLVAALLPVTVQDGDAVFREGDPGDRLYVVRRGTIRIERQGRLIATVQSGGCFGELAVIGDAVRSASAVAHGRAELLALDAVEFRALTAGAG